MPIANPLDWLPKYQTNPPVEFYFTVLIFDVVFGVLRAIKEKRLNSTIARDGMIVKAAMILFVGLAMLLERYTYDIPISKVVAFCFSGVEILSIIENAQLIGVKGLDSIKPYLEKVASGRSTDGH